MLRTKTLPQPKPDMHESKSFLGIGLSVTMAPDPKTITDWHLAPECVSQRQSAMARLDLPPNVQWVLKHRHTSLICSQNINWFF